MQGLRQFGGGLILALFSITLILGGLSLALAEGYVPPPPPTPTETRPVFTFAPTGVLEESSPLPTFTFTVTATLVPSAFCPIPPGWMTIRIQPGDTLAILAARYGAAPEILMRENCLVSATLLPGTTLSVPIPPAATATPCGHPSDWTIYTVQPGDNLFRIGLLYNKTASQLQLANCLGDSTIFPGQKLWVPNVATSTPPATPINIEFFTETPAPANTLEATPSEIPAPTETPSPTETSPPTETPFPTETPEPTDTPLPPTP